MHSALTNLLTIFMVIDHLKVSLILTLFIYDFYMDRPTQYNVHGHFDLSFERHLYLNYNCLNIRSGHNDLDPLGVTYYEDF